VNVRLGLDFQSGPVIAGIESCSARIGVEDRSAFFAGTHITPGLDEQHLVLGIGGKPVGENASRTAPADNDNVPHAASFP
jgi:hypothetical protein